MKPLWGLREVPPGTFERCLLELPATSPQKPPEAPDRRSAGGWRATEGRPAPICFRWRRPCFFLPMAIIFFTENWNLKPKLEKTGDEKRPRVEKAQRLSLRARSHSQPLSLLEPCPFSVASFFRIWFQVFEGGPKKNRGEDFFETKSGHNRVRKTDTIVDGKRPQMCPKNGHGCGRKTATGVAEKRPRLCSKNGHGCVRKTDTGTPRRTPDTSQIRGAKGPPKVHKKTAHTDAEKWADTPGSNDFVISRSK